MRHLLFLSHRIPFPPDKGDKIRSYHVLRHLSSRFKVHLGCFFDQIEDRRHIAPLREICADVHCLPLARAKKMLRALHAVAAGKSISETCYQDPMMRAWVRSTLAQNDIRNVFVFSSAMSLYAPERAPDMRVVIDMVDVDSEKWGSYARSAWWPLAMLYRFEQRHVLALEKRAGAGCDRALFVSQAEAEAFLRLAPELSGQVGLLENGVDLHRFDATQRYSNPFGASGLPIVFTGAMDYRANVDAVIWFAREAFPGIRRAHPQAEFWIVGANPTAVVRRLSRHPSICVTGAVTDVRPYLGNATCAVAPLRIARGVQNKVLEAMAMAKPVVLTPAALEGLHAVPEREVLLARSAEDFTHRVSEILSGHWKELGRAARTRVERDHCWSQNLKILDELFPEIPEQNIFRGADNSHLRPAKAI